MLVGTVCCAVALWRELLFAGGPKPVGRSGVGVKNCGVNAAGLIIFETLAAGTIVTWLAVCVEP